jgi:hypothetical protein
MLNKSYPYWSRWVNPPHDDFFLRGRSQRTECLSLIPQWWHTSYKKGPNKKITKQSLQICIVVLSGFPRNSSRTGSTKPPHGAPPHSPSPASGTNHLMSWCGESGVQLHSHEQASAVASWPGGWVEAWVSDGAPSSMPKVVAAALQQIDLARRWQSTVSKVSKKSSLIEYELVTCCAFHL